MTDVIFNVSVNEINKTVTVVDNGTNYDPIGGMISSISVFIYTENKNNPIYVFKSDDQLDIAAYMTSDVGLVIEPPIFVKKVPDNYYVTRIVINEGEESQMISEYRVFAVVSSIRKQLHINALAVNFPPVQLLNSLSFSMALQMLEMMELLSNNSLHNYDRENKWRKLYNGINAVVDEYKY